MKIETWNIEEMTGYKPISTFYEDFSIADIFGINAVKDTQLVMVLNWKIWRWYESDEQLARVYNELWKKADSYAMDNLKDDELKYFLRVTD